MDNEIKADVADIALQLRRIAHALEVDASNRSGIALATPCVSCGCACIPMGAEKCPVCRTGRGKVDDGIETG